ncbi:MAG: hypothetical protein RR206_04805 [Bacteroidaceae bacterium]
MGIRIGNTAFVRAFFGGKDLAAIALGSRVVWRRAAAGQTHTITVGINPGNIGQCTVTATGAVVATVPSADKNSYTITATHGGSVTVKIVAADGFEVERLNVDTVSQGAVSVYELKNITADHTMYIWMKEAAVVVTRPVYIRSDLQTIEYKSLYSAVSSLTADYPEGLTKDTSITCISGGIDYRDNGIDTKPKADTLFNVTLRSWNQNTPFLLTLDGANLAVIDGQGFGGIYILDSSNLYIRNFTFRNCNTYEGVDAPEETACIYGNRVEGDARCRNLYIENVTIEGQSTLHPTSLYRTRYGITVKNYENAYICNSRMNCIACVGITLTDVTLSSVVKTDISGIMQPGIIGHPRIITGSGCHEIRIEDCDLNCETFNETAISLDRISNVYLRRNHIYNCGAPVMDANGLDFIDNVVIDCNYMHDNLLKPLFQWEAQYFSLSPVCNNFIVTNNLVIFSSPMVNEFFVRATIDIDNFVNANNIFIKKGTSTNFCLFLFEGLVKSPIICTNIYKLATATFYKMTGLSSSDGRNFSKIQSAGYEAGSLMVSPGTNILISETGGTRNCLIPTYAASHKSTETYVGEFDIRYKKNNAQETSLGAENYYATDYDETIDTSTGYDGTDIDWLKAFTSEAVYNLPGDNTVVLHHHSKQRARFIKFIISSADNPSDKILALGKHTIFSLQPKLDDNGEYVSDQLYNIEIE